MSPAHAPRRLTIATRESALALWQAEHIRARLAALYPGTAIALLGLTTQGDRIVDQPLAAIGGKGLFIKELEVAMAEGRADLAVHSLKDVPMDVPPGFTLAAVVAREDPRDAFVSTRYTRLAELPKGAVVGTSSLRREAQVRERHPQLAIESLRGNINTRLRKLDEGLDQIPIRLSYRATAEHKSENRHVVTNQEKYRENPVLNVDLQQHAVPHFYILIC